MLPWIMEAAGLLLATGALYQAGQGLLTGVRRRAAIHKEQAEALEGFRRSVDKALVKASSERLPEDSSWSGYRKFYIHQRVDEAEHITSFYLRPYDGKPVPRFLPGQHLTFRLQIPGRPLPVIRCYSLSDAPIHQNQYRITVKRLAAPESRGEGAAAIPDGVGSSFFHDTLETGRIIDVKAPSGNFYLDLADQRPLVLIAGGMGLTPMLSMINTVTATGSKREVWLFYSLRNRQEHVMPAHLRRLLRENPNVRVVICYTRPTRDCVKGRDFHYRGRVSRRLLQGLLPHRNCIFYMCGPLEMQDELTRDLKDWGVPRRDIRTESFGRRKGNKKAVSTVHGSVSGGDAVEVSFARSGRTGIWQPGDTTLLEVAEAAGVVIDSGCRAGQCGTCETVIKQGSVDYLEEPAAPPPVGTCLACIATPRKGLVLDA
jgi:ferredoxin-NADP reductase